MLLMCLKPSYFLVFDSKHEATPLTLLSFTIVKQAHPFSDVLTQSAAQSTSPLLLLIVNADPEIINHLMDCRLFRK